ncbi:VOC family protein [Halalkalibacterium halodurans]|uniref:VOC family protein n=1 Tax=Halalkalibacterium halodurans TaxID=86665 RepID=UPI001067F0BA|nr:VOC family protein [Halalkalibacterium halodurans]TES53242.1 VOC family protein [Halalkalibacterium halodurans]
MNIDLLYGVGIFIPVRHLAKATDWYKEMLGFEMIHDDSPAANVLKVGDGTVTFCLVTCEDIEQPKFPQNDYEVNVYFNFHTNDVGKAHQLLSSKGANVGEIHDYGKVRGFDLIDLDGNHFGVVT